MSSSTGKIGRYDSRTRSEGIDESGESGESGWSERSRPSGRSQDSEKSSASSGYQMRGAPPDDPSGLGLGSTILSWLPIIALITVALVQIVTAQRTELSPWKGGGFGMFSTFVQRTVEVYATLPNDSGELIETKLDPPRSLELAARHYPNQRHSRRLASWASRRRSDTGVPATNVRVEVWQLVFDPVTHSLERHWLITFRPQGPGSARK